MTNEEKINYITFAFREYKAKKAFYDVQNLCYQYLLDLGLTKISGDEYIDCQRTAKDKWVTDLKFEMNPTSNGLIERIRNDEMRPNEVRLLRIKTYKVALYKVFDEWIAKGVDVEEVLTAKI